MAMKRIFGVVLLVAAAAAGYGFYASQKTERPVPANSPSNANLAGRNATKQAPHTVNPTQSYPGALGGPINSSARFAALRDRAKTDPGVAYPLALLLHQCRQMSETLDAIAEANEVRSGKQDVAAMMDRADALQAQCAHIPAQELGSYRKLIQSAADAGIVDAQVDYATLVSAEFNGMHVIRDSEEITEFKKKSIGYLNRAVRAGSAKAMQNLAFAYADGVLAKRDPLQAYAYAFAFTRAHNGVRNQQFLQAFGRGMSPTQIHLGQETGEAIYRYSQGK
ncbi:MAG: hypothetical protein EPO46_03215 [Lysobacter sp.]|nr:MAG: hypothetical protein EPO46_03215 [Lysobacter sp.]